MRELLKDATRRLLLQHPTILSIPKQGYEIGEDYITIIDFIKDNCKVQQESREHIFELIKDKTVLKRYFSNEIAEEFNYLPFIQLGIEFLLQYCEFENAEKGKKILYDKINTAIKEVNK